MTKLLNIHSKYGISLLETNNPTIAAEEMQDSLEAAYSASPKPQVQSLGKSPVLQFKRASGQGELVIHFLERVVDAAFVRYRH